MYVVLPESKLFMMIMFALYPVTLYAYVYEQLRMYCAMVDTELCICSHSNTGSTARIFIALCLVCICVVIRIFIARYIAMFNLNKG